MNFLEGKPELADLTFYLGTNACLSGELSKVYIGRIEDQGTISSIASFGYKSDEIELVNTLNLQDNKPICLAARKNIMIVRGNDDEYYAEFSNATNFSDEWQSIVCLSLPPRYVMTLALQIRVQNDLAQIEYYELLGVLVRFYINLEMNRKEKEFGHLHFNQLRGKPLTSRQELLLELLKRGFTNREIAQEINYSESLIRQETVIIYAKLGISGKKELMTSHSSQNQNLQSPV